MSAWEAVMGVAVGWYVWTVTDFLWTLSMQEMIAGFRLGNHGNGKEARHA